MYSYIDGILSLWLILHCAYLHLYVSVCVAVHGGRSGGRRGESERPWSTGWVRVQRVQMARSGFGIAADISASLSSHNYGFPLRRGSFLSSQKILDEEDISCMHPSVTQTTKLLQDGKGICSFIPRDALNIIRTSNTL